MQNNDSINQESSKNSLSIPLTKLQDRIDKLSEILNSKSQQTKTILSDADKAQIQKLQFNMNKNINLTTIQPLKESMGNLKHSISFGKHSKKGNHRPTMEDKDVTVVDFDSDPKTNSQVSYFAVYDGHGGVDVVDYVSEHFHGIFRGVVPLSDENIRKSFIDFDKVMRSRGLKAGSTCVTTFLVRYPDRTEIICANIGDSRAIMYHDGKCTPLSNDHKPNNEDEKKRIKASGYLVFNGRVGGDLAVSRAFGDFEFKESDLAKIPFGTKLDPKEFAVTANPEIQRITIKGKISTPSFIVLACDGIWDKLTNDVVCKFVNDGLIDQRKKQDFAGKYDLDIICENLIGDSITKGSKDNCTAILVLLE